MKNSRPDTFNIRGTYENELGREGTIPKSSPINLSNVSRCATSPEPSSLGRRDSFFRQMSFPSGSFRNSSIMGCAEMAMGSLRHSSMQGMPPVVAMTPDIEQKLLRVRTTDFSPESTGVYNKIPTEASEITWDWVRVVLNQYRLTFCNKPAVTRESLIDVSISDCKKSVGDFSSTYRIDVTIEDEEYESYNSSQSVCSHGNTRICGYEKSLKHSYSFIAKLLPADDPARACVFEANLLEKEIELYFELLPSLRQFIRLTEMKRRPLIDKDKNPESQGGTSPTASIHSRQTFIDSLTPQCVYSSHNTDGAGVIVFKNSCSDASFQDCSDPNGMSLSQVLTVVKAMAKFHAAGRAFLARNKTQAVKRRYPYLEEDMYSNGSFVQEVNGHLTTYDEFLKTAAQELEKSSPSSLTFSQLSPKLHSNYEHHNLSHTSIIEARKQFGRVLNIDTWQLVEGLCRSGPSTLTTICHGELWERNILLKVAGTKDQSSSSSEHSNDDLKILDWKNVKIATATLDLAFLMLTSTKSDLRSESTGEILSTYHDVFCQYLSILNPALEKPTIEELEVDYYHSLEYAVLQAICMFVQQMHFYNTIIEEMQTQSLAGSNTVGLVGNQSASKDCFPTQISGGKSDSINLTTDEENVCQSEKSYNDALDRLRSYECRALNLFRDVDITHIHMRDTTSLHSFDDEPSARRRVSESEDGPRSRAQTLSGGLAGLHDPNNMPV